MRKVIPKKNDAYKSKEFWDDRYKETKEEITEWFKGYEDLRTELRSEVGEPSETNQPRILMLGCGNSKLSEDMYKDGYRNIVSIDFSEVVINQMKEKHKEDCPELEWQVMDVLDLTFTPEEQFDFAIDKGTMDAVMGDSRSMWEVPEEVQSICSKMSSETSKVLKPGGKYIQITFVQPHFRKPVLLANVEQCNWSLANTLTLGGGDSFNYFIYVMQKSS
eukprot:TRINITY_DN5341_c0_g1_i2.p1 TRINITY_DN5341_c0_g1~~TRINITY_DN5341_c0_g1_i2.p1  ORF type:complete len:227 (+),score=42.74 TRINITY_DN5341_c0_g1_i2:27-683(+)